VTSQYQLCHNWKYHGASDNEKHVPFLNVLLAQTKA